MNKIFFTAVLLLSATLFISSCKRECDAGWEGTDCDTEQREKFIGTFNGDVVCGVSPDTYTLWISKTAGEDVQLVDVLNIDNRNLTYTGKVLDNTLEITEQTKSGITVEAEGVISGDTLTLDYTITDSVGAKSCTFTGVF